MLSSGFQTLSFPWSQIPSLLNKLTSPNVQINNIKGRTLLLPPKLVQNRLDTTAQKSVVFGHKDAIRIDAYAPGLSRTSVMRAKCKSVGSLEAKLPEANEILE